MRDRLTALGWLEIEVIDDDLGRSAAGDVQRAGFERMVAQVCLGKVGAVAAREVSRFARNRGRFVRRALTAYSREPCLLPVSGTDCVQIQRLRVGGMPGFFIFYGRAAA